MNNIKNMINLYNKENLTLEKCDDRILYSIIDISIPLCTTGVCDIICSYICTDICDEICDEICDAVCDRICDAFCEPVFLCDNNYYCDLFCDRVIW